MTKRDVLTLLRYAGKEPISGEELSAKIGVSRTAVWKHIQALKEEGYQINAHPGKGYYLLKVPDLLLPAEIQQYLSGGKLGSVIEHHYELNSTNERAKELATEGVPEGVLVVAESQNRGKGRLGRGWFSPEGTGIYLSLIFRPSLTPEKAPGFTLLGAVALARAVLEVTDLKVGIKWPNDLLVEGKKFAGILTEMKGEMDRIHSLILGVGINVNTNPEDFPKEIQGNAISLKTVLGRPVSRVQLIGAYLTVLEELYDEYLESGLEPILKAWKEWNITLGQWITVSSGTEKFYGQAIDLDEKGSLIVKDNHGEIRSFISGEVTLKK